MFVENVYFNMVVRVFFNLRFFLYFFKGFFIGILFSIVIELELFVFLKEDYERLLVLMEFLLLVFRRLRFIVILNLLLRLDFERMRE